MSQQDPYDTSSKGRFSVPVASNDERIVRALEEIAGALHRIEDHLRSVIGTSTYGGGHAGEPHIKIWDDSRD